VEINEKAAAAAQRRNPEAHVLCQSFLDFETRRTWDLAFVRGVLIHIMPEMLPRAYAVLHKTAAKHILVAEYYSPKPVEVEYRGHSGRLFKRDFAGEMLDAYPDLELADYGFVYHRDPLFPQDDITYFLLRKR
jgi:spore coat polysaccharide biosynthesis protein SpsF